MPRKHGFSVKSGEIPVGKVFGKRSSKLPLIPITVIWYAVV
jgi:hypothetical protein